jgi:hypothetical protein
MNMTAILAQVFSPATRTQCLNMNNEILIPMQQFRITKTTALVQKFDWQSDLDYREGASLYQDFFDLYFYFVSNLI